MNNGHFVFLGQTGRGMSAVSVIVASMSQQEIEAMLRAKLHAGEIETGLFTTGRQYVVMDRVGNNDELTFAWFDEIQSVDQLVDA